MSTLNSSLSRSKYVVWPWLFGISSFRIKGVFVLLRYSFATHLRNANWVHLWYCWRAYGWRSWRFQGIFLTMLRLTGSMLWSCLRQQPIAMQLFYTPSCFQWR